MRSGGVRWIPTWAWALAGVAALAGCQSEGQIRLSFSVNDVLPEDPSGLFFHAQVRDPDGVVLAGAVAPADGSAPLRLNVLHGDQRVAALELRDGPAAATSQVLAYGLSDAFSLQPGASGDVQVSIEMRRVPSILRVAPASGAGGSVRDAQVDLRVEADRGDLASAIVAQDPSLTFRRATFELDGQASLHEVSYDLEQDCESAGGCRDGLRAVFVQLVDRAGYTSTATSITVTLDRAPPVVLEGSAAVAFELPGTLVPPTAAAPTGTVRLTFGFNEPVTSTPTVQLEGSGLPFEFERNEFGAWTFRRVITGEDPAGRQQPLVTGVDAAGNAVPFAAQRLVYNVDTSAPAPPDVETSGRIVYERVPWGTFAQAGARYAVTGTVGAAEPGTRVVAYDQRQALDGGVEVATRIGEAPVADDGSFRVPLSPFDRPEVFILVYGPTGAPHDADGRATRVRNVALLAPALPDGSGPPTQVYTRDRLSASLRYDAVGVEATLDGAGLAAADGAGPSAQYDLRWTQWNPAVSPLPDELRGAATTYDPVRARGVIFGGRDADGPRIDTWEWDGLRWTLFPRTGTEPDCRDGSSAGDEARAYLDYHGAFGASVLLCRRLDPDQPPPLPEGSVDELAAYGWNGERWGSVPIAGEPAPGGRNGHATAYHAGMGATLVFGGNRSSLSAGGQFDTGLDDLWALEALPPATPAGEASLRWRALSPTGRRPPARDRHAMAYAPGQGVILFGGIGASRARPALSDMWIWEGEAWREVPRGNPWPPARACHTMVYDPDSGAVGLLGGVSSEPGARCSAQSGLQDAWWWDGAGWTRAADRGATPGGAGVTAFSFPPTREVVAITGPTSGTVGPSATWRAAPAGWFPRTPTDARPPQQIRPGFPSIATAFDPRRDAALTHTSYVLASQGSETWTWDAGGWRRLSRNTDIGNPFALGYDPARQLMVVQAGLEGQPVLQFQDDGTGWRQSPISPTSPAAVTVSSMVFDPVLQQLVILALDGFEGGVGTGSALWTWDGAIWSPLWTSAAADIVRAQFVHEMPQDRYVGVRYPVPDFEQFVGDRSGPWTRTTPDGQAWSNSTVIFRDHVRGKTYLLGRARPELELFELDAGTWRLVPTGGTVPPRAGFPTPVYDPLRRRFVRAEVRPVDGQVVGRVHLLDVDPTRRPAVSVRLELGPVSVPPTAIEAVVLDSAAGGRGNAASDGATVLGARWQAWDHRAMGWVEVGQGGGAPAAPERFLARIEGAAARALVSADARRLDVAVTPIAGLGAGSSSPEVRLDRLLIRLEYRLE